jgi:putative hydrolase of the HAD superfamily
MNTMECSREKSCTVEVIFFDFGGVLAEEGYRKGLMDIGARSGIDPSEFLQIAFELSFTEGFVTGRLNEGEFWHILRNRTGVTGSVEVFREAVFSGFEMRAWMVELVRKLKESGTRTAILSDQTTWLDELNEKHQFFQWFERVFNSYYIGMSKREPALFDYALSEMGVRAEQTLFVDDNRGNIERAQAMGLHTIHYQNRKDFEEEFFSFCPDLIL